AIITATKRNPEMVGALYPFPLILDGDFNIPVAYCTDVVGDDILGDKGSKVQILIESERFASSASNIIARKNAGDSSKILVTAHIDAYEDTPGASDNASGTAVLLLLAEMLSDYDGDKGVEITALNGEDHYSAGGQMDYLARFRDEFDNILLLINIDDVGYVKGRTAYSTYGLPAEIQGKAEKVFEAANGFVLGEPWYNGDHMIFVQSGVPAMALSAELTPELMRTITHTTEDTLDKVDPARLVGLANTLSLLVRQL
ncbi:MAG: M28 family metallopeptidase, partial [Candidatus Promineifilaceae bacterium]